MKRAKERERERKTGADTSARRPVARPVDIWGKKRSMSNYTAGLLLWI